MMAPIVERLYDEFTSVEMLEVDTDAAQLLSRAYSISALPTFLYFHKGKEVQRIRGAQPNEVRDALVKLAGLNPKARRSAAAPQKSTGYVLGSKSDRHSAANSRSYRAPLTTTIWNALQLYVVTFLAFDARQAAQSLNQRG
jgi:thioredoxin-like negative regulator of GroEL